MRALQAGAELLELASDGRSSMDGLVKAAKVYALAYEQLQEVRGVLRRRERIDSEAGRLPNERRGTDMNFGLALDALKEGRRVYRAGWNGKGMWIALQVPDEHSKMRRPYIYISDAQGLLVPWLASQADMLAEDWAEVAE
jgi:transposase